MIGRIRSWAALRKSRRAFEEQTLALYEVGLANMPAPHEAFIVRKMSDDRLHAWLAKNPTGEAKVALERELRRREAWAAPAGKAFWISIGSLAVAIVALLVGLARLG
jgi:hypothetical protein